MTRFESARRFAAVGALLLAAVAAFLGPGCKRSGSKPPAKAPEKPALRLYALAGAAGAVEPCGCVKDMLGGVDHAAAFVNAQKGEAASSLVVGAGPMLFGEPHLPNDEHTQALFKAEALAQSMKDIGLVAWAPGANDWALGEKELARLETESGAALLAANLSGDTAGAQATKMVEVGGYKVGLVGVSVPEARGPDVEGLKIGSAAEALRAGHQVVTKKGAQIAVALIAAQRGQALRLAETVGGFQVAVVGKGFDQGDANDPTFSPTIVGDTLVVQAPNHVQRIAVVDLYVRDNDFQFADGSGLAAAEERESLARRIDILKRRIARWEAPDSGVASEEVAARKKDLGALEKKYASLAKPEPPKEGSYFTYELVDVRESLGVDQRVGARLEAYYKRVNAHNAKAFADRKPPPVEEGQSRFVGVEQCSNCHLEERAFWDKTRHAGAYETLVVGHKEFNLDCVSCHVTGYEKPGGSTVTHVEDFKDVQCEVCHGPGSRHVADPADKSLITRTPALTLCASQCHHPPHVADDWNVGEAWPKIIGPGHGR